MKIIKTGIYISTIIMIACNNPGTLSTTTIKSKYAKLDSVIFKSKESVTSVGRTNQQSDSTISKKQKEL